jgi:hypothetical protein
VARQYMYAEHQKSSNSCCFWCHIGLQHQVGRQCIAETQKSSKSCCFWCHIQHCTRWRDMCTASKSCCLYSTRMKRALWSKRCSCTTGQDNYTRKDLIWVAGILWPSPATAQAL